MDVVALAKQMQEDLGYVNYKELIEKYGATPSAIHRVGGVKHICSEFSLTYKCAHKLEPDDIKEDFLRVYELLGEINTDLYLEYGRYSKQAIKTAFGSVNKLMAELGIPLNSSRFASKEEIINDIRRVYEEHNSTSSTVYRKYGLFAQSVIERNWGSWSNALAELNLEGICKKVGRDTIIKELNAVLSAHGFLSKDLIDRECTFTYQAASIALGGMDGICSVLGKGFVFNKRESTGHRLIREILERHVGSEEFTEEQTFDWAINSETMRPLYYDFYIPSLSKLVEFDGAQHFIHTKYFHETEDAFAAAQRRDVLKNELAIQNGLTVIRFSFKDELSDELVTKKIFS